MLMQDFGGQPLDGQPLEHWEATVRCYAKIQRGCSDDQQRWLALGPRDLRPDRLVDTFSAVLNDASVLGIDTASGLTHEQVNTLRDLVPLVREQGARLAGNGLPAMVIQHDFRPANIVVRDGVPLLYDWSFTVRTHPFFGVRYFLNHARPVRPDEQDQPDVEERVRIRIEQLRNVYLELWRDDASQDQLEASWHLVAQLEPVYALAVTYSELSYLEEGTAWYITLATQGIPHLLKWALGTLAEDTTA